MAPLTGLATDKKMTVIFRVEPGSLGPDGKLYINEFCEFAQTQLQASAAYYLNWFIVPRFDKTLSEINFQLANKAISQQQASQYLKLFGDDYAHFEEQLDDHLEALINQYFGR